MKGTCVAILLALATSSAAQAADYRVVFGEIRDGVVVATHTIKKCEKKTGYAFGFAIELPAQGSYEVAGDLYWPPPPGKTEKDVGVSSRHVMDSYGKHTGRYVKSLTFDADDLTGTYALAVIVNHEPVTSIRFNVVAATNCP